ncbi:MAG: heat-inducible transcriptional repressor HrcA, partial [Anaerolineae bacterium]|nr:heat-inducible transcriptional repressor HrcA [Anaerolineae bacterium]
MVESLDLTPRQESILRLIVKLHVDTAGTVASRTLVDQYGLNISPATVRNEMARLEDLGYLQQPHTSAGRIPTEMGFRYYVQRLMEESVLPQSEQRKIAHQFHQARDHIDTWLPLASSVLAKTARAAAVLTAPRSTIATFKHLELIATHGRTVLLIMVLEGGSVEQQMLSLSELMPQTSLREAADRLNQVCAGLNASQIEARLNEFPPLETDIAKLVISLMHNVEEELSDDIYYYGMSDLLNSPEFSEPDTTSLSLVRSLEERSLLHAVLSETLTPAEGVGTVRVLIGGEGRWDELRSCSVVLARY